MQHQQDQQQKQHQQDQQQKQHQQDQQQNDFLHKDDFYIKYLIYQLVNLTPLLIGLRIGHVYLFVLN